MLKKFLNEWRPRWQMINFNLAGNLVFGEALTVAQRILQVLALLLVHSFWILMLWCILFAILRNNKFWWRLFRRWELRIVCCANGCPRSCGRRVPSQIYVLLIVTNIFSFLSDRLSELNLAPLNTFSIHI